MTTPTLETHNVLLGDGSTTLGLILVPDKSGTLIRRGPAPPLAAQQYQTLGQEAFIPQQEQPFSVKTNHAGFGRQFWTLARYQAAYGTDASVKNLIKLSPVIVATTNTTASYSVSISMANGDFEADTTWTYVTTFARTAAAARSGSWGARVTYPTVAAATMSQQLTFTGAPLATGLTATLTFWARYNTAEPALNLVVTLRAGSITGPIVATLYDAKPAASFTEYSGNHAFTDNWESLFLVFTYPTEGSTTGSIDIDDITLSITGSITTSTAPNTVVKLIDFNNTSYLISDSGVWKRSAANWVRVAGSPVGIVDAVSDGTNLHLARGITKYTWYMNTSEAFTRIDYTASRCSKLAYMGGSMYGMTAANTLSKFTSITAGTVAASYTVGLTGYNATTLLDHLDLPTVVYENWAGYINASGTVIEIASELRSMFNANTGKNSISWRGNGAQTLYIPAGAGATMLAYDAGDVVNMGPDMFAERLSDYEGQIVAITSDDQWLYVVLDNGTKIEILKGRYETIDEVTDFRWHPIVEDTYTTVGYAFITSITAKRLYYGGGTALPKYISLAGSSFATGGTHLTAILDMGLPNVLKNARSIALITQNLAAAKTVKVEYALEGSSTWVELGGSGNGSFTTSPYQEKFFASGINERLIQLRFTLTTDSASVSPYILLFTLNYVLNPPLLDVIEFDAILKKENHVKSGDLDTEMTYPYVMNKLRSWKSTIPLTLTLPDGLWSGSQGELTGEAISVHFVPGYPAEAMKLAPKNDPHTDAESIVAMKFYQLRTS